MKKSHAHSSKKLMAIVLVVFFLIALTTLGISQLNAGAFYGSLFGSSADVDQDTNSVIPESLDPGEVWAGKNVAKHTDVLSNGKFDVELSALGRDYESESSENQQYDVVFVLDASSSMDSGGKLASMISAANDAIGILLDDPDPSDSIYNRAAVITFSQGATPLSGWTSDDTYAIDSVSTAMATNMQQGLYEAKSLLNTARSAAKPVIILLSDGAPNQHAEYDFSSESPLWIDGSTVDTYGADNSSVYTILYAAWLKAQVPGLKIYTVGFDVESSSRAQAVLNPAAGLTPGIDILLADARTTTGVTSSVNYPDGYYAANINNLSTILPALTSSITTSGPILEDLVITDTIPAEFDVDQTSFVLNGASITLDSGNTYEDPSTHETVFYDTANGQVVYTIPADALQKYYDSNESDTPNTLAFIVTLNDSATSAGIKYYTDAGCTAQFLPAFDNPYYEYVEESSVTTDVIPVGIYTNVYSEPAQWDEEGSSVELGALSSNAVYTPVDLTGMSSVTVLLTYSNVPINFTDRPFEFTSGITVGSAAGSGSGRYFPVTITGTATYHVGSPNYTWRAVPGAGGFSFDYYPDNADHYQNISGSIAYAYHSGNVPADASGGWTDAITTTGSEIEIGACAPVIAADSLTVTSVTAAGYDFTATPSVIDISVGSGAGTGDDRYFPVTVTGEAEITEGGSLFLLRPNFSFDYTPHSTDPYQNVSGTIMKYAWIPGTLDSSEFTVTVPPTGDNTPATVVVDAVTYSGTDTAFTSDTSWSFTQTVDLSSTVTRVYTILFSSDAETMTETLTVSYVETTRTPAYWTHTPSINLPETGWIILAVPQSSPSPDTSPSPYIPPYYPPSSEPSPSPSPSTDPSPSPSPEPSPEPSSQPSPSPSPSPSSNVEKLPQTGGISFGTLLGIIGFALIITGCAVFLVLRKIAMHKSH